MPADRDAHTFESDSTWLIPKPVLPLMGEERFSDNSSSVLDLWRWAFSDLRTNIVRGVAPSFAAGTEILTRTASWLNHHLQLSSRPSASCTSE